MWTRVSPWVQDLYGERMAAAAAWMQRHAGVAPAAGAYTRSHFPLNLSLLCLFPLNLSLPYPPYNLCMCPDGAQVEL